ncbi:hypothetical protein PQQ51_22455, partial [Paraburkholderia xenovorans]|uniref:hypothetical protein n=1 Tax=Paraburkholderia xenovorans TaxID=36873 RepID=UPI0038BD6C20
MPVLLVRMMAFLMLLWGIAFGRFEFLGSGFGLPTAVFGFSSFHFISYLIGLLVLPLCGAALTFFAAA